MPTKGKKRWFRVKRYGYGAGLPIAWEGWLVLSLYIAAMLLTGALLPTLAFVLAAVPLSAAVIYTAYVRSDGEWRYRNGK